MYTTPVPTNETRSTAQASDRANGTAPQPYDDLRTENAAQQKLQTLADNSPQVRQLQKVGEGASPVAQLAKADVKKQQKTHYRETYKMVGKVGKKKHRKDVMLKISQADYDLLPSNAKATEEEGYSELDLEVGEKPLDWTLNDRVVTITGGQIVKNGTFKLPVSCIESAEHVVHYSRTADPIPDWQDGQNKSVDLKLNNPVSGNNETALNVSNDELLQSTLQSYGSFDFSADDIKVNEGLLLINPKAPTSTLHAVVVVGKNKKTGQIVVLERNAGATSGNTTYYIDNSWLINAYDSPDAFLASMHNADLVIGKLVAS